MVCSCPIFMVSISVRIDLLFKWPSYTNRQVESFPMFFWMIFLPPGCELANSVRSYTELNSTITDRPFLANAATFYWLKMGRSL